MDEANTILEVCRDGKLDSEVVLEGETFSIGRGSSTFDPDLSLDDPHSWISRRHCVISQALGTWWIEDCGSRNGTFIRNGDSLTRLKNKTQLSGSDVICITADADETGPTSTWELRVIDPSATVTLDVSLTSNLAPVADEPAVRWDAEAMTLTILGRGCERTVELRKQGQDLVAHMASRNADHEGDPVVCSVEELLVAVWGEPDSWDKYHPPTPENLRDLILAVRKAIEPNSGSPQILQNQRGVGYKLRTVPA